MDLIVCIDERNGMCFAGRRQSSDRLLREDLLAMTQGVPLWMAPYSAKQFEALPENVRVAENFMEEAGVGEYCFCELQLPPKNVESITVYRWNRHYPADVVLPDSWLQCRKLTEQKEFPGSSHETITREVYRL